MQTCNLLCLYRCCELAPVLHIHSDNGKSPHSCYCLHHHLTDVKCQTHSNGFYTEWSCWFPRGQNCFQQNTGECSVLPTTGHLHGHKRISATSVWSIPTVRVATIQDMAALVVPVCTLEHIISYVGPARWDDLKCVCGAGDINGEVDLMLVGNKK